ncbi:hypothetical protein NAPIS_ORF02259 [Vairimorpha apis BRL 01]|uniref:Uncharacterized protein n=1 Tax=Vairimorpha apis BRL 01 TaxID=1037528 RepID=T0L6N4_9MICR|nr:hypothetical protein NAPIS_ORF02259 [Vairimorpha apis BRL 01]
MYIIFIFVYNIICSIQNISEIGNKNTIINKRKYINETETSINISKIILKDKLLSEHLALKKPKITDENKKCYDNYNFVDLDNVHDDCLQYKWNDNLEIENEFFEIMKTETNNEDVKVEQSLFENTNFYDELINTNKLCNYEDYNDHCESFSLKLFDDINIEEDFNLNCKNDNNKVIFERKSKQKLDEIKNQISLDEKYKNGEDKNKIFVIPNDDLKKLIVSADFTNTFDIIFQDLLNIIKRTIEIFNRKKR